MISIWEVCYIFSIL